MVNFAEGVSQLSETNKRQVLTRRQQEIYDFLADKITNRGYGPTVREIGLEFKIKSPNGVMCHLKALERKGLIRRESNMSRAICLVDSSSSKSTLKMLGTASSGAALKPADPEDESMDLGSMVGADHSVCVQIEGAHYSSLGINDGDMLVIREEDSQPAGALVAALDDRRSLVLSRRNAVNDRLVPVVPVLNAGPLNSVIGTVTAVIRKFSPLDVEQDVESMIA
ncbi:MAG: repressor LexA [Fuerstiella sp.]